MTEIMLREASGCTLSQLTNKLIPEVIGREIEKSTQGIYPLQNVCVSQPRWPYIRADICDLGARPQGETPEIAEIRSWCASKFAWGVIDR